ncbi:MAG: hypothetical protein ABFD75_12430 [Smithella sp.]
MKNYCTKDSTCSASSLEETKACAFYAPFRMNGDTCTFCNRNCVCMSPEAFKEATEN